MKAMLSALEQQFPIPRHWGSLRGQHDRMALTECPPGSELEIQQVGLWIEEGLYPGITGSAAEMSQGKGQLSSRAVERAFFELLERGFLLDAEALCKKSDGLMLDYFNERGETLGTQACRAILFPEAGPDFEGVYSKSNGVAIHTSFASALGNSAYELLERDRILRFWFSRKRPQEIPAKLPTALAALADRYQFHAFLFNSGKDIDQQIAVVGIFGFPRGQKDPLLMGFGGAAKVNVAVSKATNEVLQRLISLKDEPLSTDWPEPSATPLYHLEYYQVPEAWNYLKQWLGGELKELPIALPVPRWRDLQFFKLPLLDLPNKESLFLIKARSDLAFDLTFGKGHPKIDAAMSAQIPLHPIA